MGRNPQPNIHKFQTYEKRLLTLLVLMHHESDCSRILEGILGKDGWTNSGNPRRRKIIYKRISLDMSVETIVDMRGCMMIMGT